MKPHDSLVRLKEFQVTEKRRQLQQLQGVLETAQRLLGVTVQLLMAQVFPHLWVMGTLLAAPSRLGKRRGSRMAGRAGARGSGHSGAALCREILGEMLSRHPPHQSPDKPTSMPRLPKMAQRTRTKKGAQRALAPSYRTVAIIAAATAFAAAWSWLGPIPTYLPVAGSGRWSWPTLPWRSPRPGYPNGQKSGWW